MTLASLSIRIKMQKGREEQQAAAAVKGRFTNLSYNRPLTVSRSPFM